MTNAAAPRPGPARLALDAWDAAEPHVLKFLLKVVLKVSIVLATPFLALSFLFLLLEKPLVWPLVPAILGALVLLSGLAGFLVLRAKLRRLRAKVEAARDVEAWYTSATGR